MKNILFKLYAIIVLSSISSTCYSQNGSEKILVTDLLKIKNIGTISISPNGKAVLYTVKSILPDTENKLEYKYATQLWLSDFNTTHQLTQSTESASQGTWAPDGQSIVFVRNVKNKSQLFLMPLFGGEALQITDSKYGVSQPKYSPDGTKIIFSANISLKEMLNDTLINPSKKTPTWSLEKPGFKNNSFLKNDSKTKADADGNIAEIRAYLAKNEEDKKAKVINRLNFQGEATTEPDISFNNLFIIEPKKDAKAEILNQCFCDQNSASWSKDNQNILFSSELEAGKHPDREQDQAIFSFDIINKKQNMIIGKKGSSYNNPILSPDNQYLALKTSPSDGVNFGQLAIAKADGSNLEILDFDRNAQNIKWTNDGKFLYFTAPANGAQPIYKYTFANKKIDQLSGLETGIIEFDINEQLVYVETSINNPAELYLSDLLFQSSKQLSSHNDWVKNKKIATLEKRNLTNSLGQKIDYWIVKPTNFEKNKKYPLLLNMHGGPTAMWGPGEQSMWHEFQYMAAQGYGIVFSNPRGSGGYGLKFQQANIRDWGNGPAEDVLAACSLAAKENWVDTSRQVLTGGSYAGYLTAWIVGHDHRFKAAFAQRGVYDLTTFMGEGNAWRLVPNYFGLPWLATDAAILKRESPYTYVDKIKTPLLIKHGENDLRTGIIQSEMLYKSMKFLGKDVEYVRMPGATHELSRTGNVRQRIDRLLRIYEFFERYIGKK